MAAPLGPNLMKLKITFNNKPSRFPVPVGNGRRGAGFGERRRTRERGSETGNGVAGIAASALDLLFEPGRRGVRDLEDPASWAYLADKHWQGLLAAATASAATGNAAAD